MIKHLIPPVLIAVVVAVSGSSCYDSSKDERALQSPPINGGNSRFIPPQQLNPPTMPRPRM